MLRIAIVDDEERIRLGLARLIGRLGGPFGVTATFAGGRECLASVGRLDADLVIVDVKMPVMDGLELIERARAVRPDLHFAVLSGFDDFEYARRALRTGAVDYLLKPVDERELHDLLVRVHRSVVKMRQSRRSALEDALALAVGADADALPEHLIESAKAELGRSGLLDGRSVLLLAMAHPPAPKPSLESRLQAERGEAAVARLSWGALAAVVRLGNGRGGCDGLWSAVESWAEHLAADDVRIGASSVFAGVSELARARREAEAALQRAWYGSGRRVFCRDGSDLGDRSAAVRLFFLLDREFWPAVETADAPRAMEALRAWIADVGEKRIPWKTLAAGFESVYAVLAGEASAGGSTDGFAGDAAGADGRSEWEPRRYPGWADYAEHFLRRAEQALSGRFKNRTESCVVDKIKAYIHRHYREDIPLSRLAEEVFLSPSYLSKLFKAETGVTITDYLIAYRIERAKALLVENKSLKTYEVGEKVGYPDPAYFNKIFKKIVGLPPQAYRDPKRRQRKQT